MPYIADTSAIGHEPDDAAHDQDHGRLEQRRQPLDLVGELRLVEVGRERELPVERARVLADAQHLRRRPREQAGRAQAGRAGPSPRSMPSRATASACAYTRLFDPSFAAVIASGTGTPARSIAPRMRKKRSIVA